MGRAEGGLQPQLTRGARHPGRAAVRLAAPKAASDRFDLAFVLRPIDQRFPGPRLRYRPATEQGPLLRRTVNSVPKAGPTPRLGGRDQIGSQGVSLHIPPGATLADTGIPNLAAGPTPVNKRTCPPFVPDHCEAGGRGGLSRGPDADRRGLEGGEFLRETTVRFHPRAASGDPHRRIEMPVIATALARALPIVAVVS